MDPGGRVWRIMKTLRIELPDDALDGMSEEQAQVVAREALLVKLYDLGVISTGRASEILGISRRAFLDLLGQYNVSLFDESMDLAEEMRSAGSAARE